MSESELVQTIASVVRRTNRGASDVTVARAIITGLSASGYEIVRTRPSIPAADDDADADGEADVRAEPRPVIDRRRRRAG